MSDESSEKPKAAPGGAVPEAASAPAAAPAAASASPAATPAAEAGTPAAPPPSLLVGAAAIEPGESIEVVLARLAKACPSASSNAAEQARLTATRVQELQELMRTRFGVEPDPDNGGPLVPAERHFELARTLKEELGYQLYVTVCASHWPAQKTKAGEDPEHFEVATVLRAPVPGTHQACWRVRVPADAPVIDSLVPLFAGADWQEREQYDLVGVSFRDHPDLRRLMMPDEWEGHPLRKDYAIDTRCVPWR
jgi:NADH-quinone oxidoreductase subunit C